MRNIFACGVAGLFVFGFNTASAALLDFNYNNLGVTGSSTSHSVDMVADSIDVNVTAYTVANDGVGNIMSLSQLVDSGTGVYVSGSASGNLGVLSSIDDGTLLDGGDSANDLDEGLLFSFSEVVSFDYINFDYFTEAGGDDFNLTVDGVTVLWDVNANNSILFSPLVDAVVGQFDEYNFNGIAGKNFLIWADGDTDSFRVDRISVSVVNSVPEPGSLLLFGVGLIGFLFRGVKNK